MTSVVCVAGDAVQDLTCADDLEVTSEKLADVVVTGVRRGLTSRFAGARGHTAKSRSGVSVRNGRKRKVLEIASGSSSSSSSSSRSCSEGRRGAAAGAALLSSYEPLDLESDQMVEREVAVSTSFAVWLQQDTRMGSFVMDIGVEVGFAPQAADPSCSVVALRGTPHVVGRTISHLDLLRGIFAEEENARCMMHLDVPSAQLGVVVGSNGFKIEALRAECGGVMVALQPASHTHMVTVCIGPGAREHVARIREVLQERLERTTSVCTTAPSHQDSENAGPSCERVNITEETATHEFESLMSDLAS